MKTINLTSGVKTFVDDEDYEELSFFRWRANWDRHSMCYRVQRTYSIGGKKLIDHMPRRIMRAPDGMLVDHINGDPLLNTRSNLRLCTPSQNQYNNGLRKDNSTGYKGVSYHKRDMVFRARITVCNKQIYIGTFETALQAAIAYDEYCRRLHGEFARLNFPDQLRKAAA